MRFAGSDLLRGMTERSALFEPSQGKSFWNEQRAGSGGVFGMEPDDWATSGDFEGSNDEAAFAANALQALGNTVAAKRQADAQKSAANKSASASTTGSIIGAVGGIGGAVAGALI